MSRDPRDSSGLEPSISRFFSSRKKKEIKDGGNAPSRSLADYSRSCGDYFTYCHISGEQESKETEEG